MNTPYWCISFTNWDYSWWNSSDIVMPQISFVAMMQLCYFDPRTQGRQACGGRANAANVRGIMKWPSLCENSSDFRSRHAFSQYRDFSFNVLGVEKHTNPWGRISCRVEMVFSDEWSLTQQRDLRTTMSYFVPLRTLTRTGGTNLVCPAEKVEVMERLRLRKEELQAATRGVTYTEAGMLSIKQE